MFIKKSINSYLQELSSKKPIPGGGSVCALSGALGAGLLLMVVNFTLNKEAYKRYFHELSAILKRLNAVEENFKKLVDRDSQAYLLIVKAYRLPKDTRLKETFRRKKIQAALKKSTAVTFEIIKHSASAMKFSRRLLDIGNKNLISDVGVGACMLESAIKGALLNVEINLAGIKDERFKEGISAKANSLVNEARKIAHFVINQTSGRIINPDFAKSKSARRAD